MDGLDDFEKQLAAEKAEREQERDRKHHKHRHHHRREREDDGEEGHRHKRSRRSPDDKQDERREHKRREHRDHHEHREHREHRHGRSHRHRSDAGELENEKHLKTSDPKGDLPLPDEETSAATKKVVRDDWMSAPSALGVDYTQKGAKREKTPPPKQEPKRAVHAREVNAAELHQLNKGKSWSEMELPAQHDVEYTFGDDGSQWRMTKLKAVYTLAEQTDRPVDEVAIERFGSLREFDDAREERTELDRRRTYGKGYVGKEKPSGELFQERKLEAGVHREAQQPADPQEIVDSIARAVDMANEAEEQAATTRIDQTMLNKIRAQMMKAKLRKAPDAAKLEAEYNQAAAAYVKQGPAPVVLNAMDNRMLAGTRAEAKAIDTKRGRERGLVEENTQMTIEDMVREERRTRGQTGGEGLRLAERIAKDGKFDNDLDYMDENAEKLAKRVQKSEINLKNSAIGDFQKINKILDRCQLCHHEDRDQPPIAPIVSLATRVYLTLPTEPELAEGGAVIVPVQHRTNLLECDDDEWEEIRNFMKCLTRMYHEQGREVVFYENAATPHRHPHAALQAVPIPYEQGDTAPAFFREAMLTADEEWSQHKKIIDTGRAASDGGLGKLAFRRSIAKEAPYFHVWFTLDGGLGHVVEDANRWPRGDLFAREIIGGMLDVGPDVIKKQGRWHKGDPRADVFKKRWRKFDWTRVLADDATA
ncbi:Pre-mRNA-splicing factor cwf19 [Apiospora phragmitis]|uniref:Pre-mRNA-splicing factor cwf19 n=1 Tax=Apiospora phragmitis TaxID=2905665 RepID=A0ABR1W6C4_9PEZI